MPEQSAEHSFPLTQQEEPFLATFALVGFGVAHFTLDGKFTMVSQRLCDIFGRPRKELLAGFFQGIVHPDDSATDWVDSRLLTGEVPTATVERRVVRNDRRTLWIKAVMAPVRDEVTREPRYIFAVVEDISARKEAERALQESEERFRLLVERAPEAILVMDPSDQRLVEANRSAEVLFGCSREELLHSGLLRFYDAALPGSALIRSAIDEHNRRALAGEDVVFERALRNAKGERRYCEVRLAPFLWGQRRLVLGSYFDITRRKQAEEALRQQVEFDDLMTRILTRFTTCAASMVDETIIDALRQLAEFVGVDHAHVIMFSADRTTWSATHEWCGPNVKPQFDHYQNLPFGTAPWSESRILAGQVIRINVLDDYPPDAPERRESDKEAGAKCTLLVPMHGAGGMITGTVGMDCHTRPMMWSDEDVARCKLVGDAIANVLERRRAEAVRLELAGRLITAQEAERTRIARELHDDIGQSLALLGIQLQRASQAPSGAPNVARIDAQELRDRVKEIGNKVSRLSHQLHSSELEYLGLEVAVKSLCREFSEQSHIAIECSCRGVSEELDGNLALGCLRVIQEALHNVIKHSCATDVQVEVIGTADSVSLGVSDNGVGFDPGKSGAGGLGLISMRERMHLIGGDFMISSSPGQGTRIKARAPLTAVKPAIVGAAHNS